MQKKKKKVQEKLSAKLNSVAFERCLSCIWFVCLLVKLRTNACLNWKSKIQILGFWKKLSSHRDDCNTSEDTRLRLKNLGHKLGSFRVRK